jgi:hypothetical protein
VNHYDRQRARRLDARERAERIAEERPPAIPSPELLPPTAEEIAEEAAVEERYQAEYRRTHYAPDELEALRRSQRQD